ncbi:MAG: DivIVA domain-containing protein [Bacilli bacterium]|nr:DivIVA domain-containing protein [Bacilli bacterium]
MDRFSIEENGYNKEEVNNFVKDVIKETEIIIERVKNQSEEIIKLKQELEHYKNLEKSLNESITKNQEINNSIRELAREESEMILENAKHNASRIVNEALLKAEKIETNATNLEKNMKIFKRKLKIIMEQQQAVVDEIEILELDPE